MPLIKRRRKNFTTLMNKQEWSYVAPASSLIKAASLVARWLLPAVQETWV